MWHQGRYADAGHYIAWVKTGIRERLTPKGAPQPMWIKFDDEKVLDMCVRASTSVCACAHICIRACLCGMWIKFDDEKVLDLCACVTMWVSV